MFARLHFAFSSHYLDEIQQGILPTAPERIPLSGSFGISRSGMPQIMKPDRLAFLKFLELDYKVVQMRVSPFDLRPTQNELIKETPIRLHWRRGRSA